MPEYGLHGVDDIIEEDLLDIMDNPSAYENPIYNEKFHDVARGDKYPAIGETPVLDDGLDNFLDWRNFSENPLTEDNHFLSPDYLDEDTQNIFDLVQNEVLMGNINPSKIPEAGEKIVKRLGNDVDPQLKQQLLKVFKDPDFEDIMADRNVRMGS